MTVDRPSLQSKRLQLGVTAAIASAALAGSFAGFSWLGWSSLPITFRFVVGLIAFGVAPGLLVVGPLLTRGRRGIGTADFVISVVTCSFSCNLAFNAALFALKWSMTDLTRAYVALQAVGYLLWGAWVWRRPPLRDVGETEPALGLNRANKAVWLLLAVAAGAVTYITYVNGSPPANSEELVWLRKLVENPSVRFDNLSFRLGDPSTYLFVPFQILIAGTSVIARADVAFTYSAFWAVSTLLSLFLIARLAHVVFGTPAITALVCLWMLAIALFDPNTVIYSAGIVVPYPNRYGFAGGVLLPLTLVLFWSILRDPNRESWRWALLVYVTLEMTFVHARETLFAVGTMAAAFAIIAARPSRNRRHLVAISLVVAVTGAVLLAYKQVNLGMAPELNAYVGGLTRASKGALRRLVSEHRPLGVLNADVPEPAVVHVDATNSMTLEFPKYRTLFVETWARSYPGRLYLAVVFLTLPLYALCASSIAELSLAVVLAGLAAIATSGLLSLALSIAVGNPEVLISYNLILLFSLLVWSAAAWRVGTAVATHIRRGPRLSLWMTIDEARTRRLSIGNARAVLLCAGCAVLLLASYLYADRMVAFSLYLSGHWTRRVARGLIVATFAAVAYRLWRRDLPLFAEARTIPAMAGPIAATLVGVLLMPAIRQSAVWQKSPFMPKYPSYRFTGDLFRDYPMSVAGNKFDRSDYPVEIIRFLREKVPANTTILTADALSLLQRVPDFAAVLSNRGNVAGSYITNWEYLRKYSHSGPAFKLLPFFADAESRRVFDEMLDAYRVDIVIVGPDESLGMRRAWDNLDSIKSRLRPALDQDGYAVYLVNRPRSDSS